MRDASYEYYIIWLLGKRAQRSRTLLCTSLVKGSPAIRQGDEKLVYRLIQLFSSTEIFSKRRKICAC